jgi:hypothetical protein
LWARANWVRYTIWKAEDQGILSNTMAMTVPDAVQAAFDLFTIDNPSDHTRAHLEAWLTAQRADANAWTHWGYLNLLTLVMLCGECAMA